MYTFRLLKNNRIVGVLWMDEENGVIGMKSENEEVKDMLRVLATGVYGAGNFLPSGPEVVKHPAYWLYNLSAWSSISSTIDDVQVDPPVEIPTTPEGTYA